MLLRFHDWITRFVAVIVTAFPLLVLGVLAYAVIEHLISRERVAQWLPKRPWLAVPVAALLGMVLPVCDCGVVPSSRALVRRELGLGPALAFLIGAPVVNPIVLVTTAVGFGFNFTIAIARLILTYIVAVGVGLLGVMAFSGEALDTLTRLQLHSVTTSSLPPPPRHKRKRDARYPPPRELPPWLRAVLPIVTEAGDQMLDLGRFLVIGALVATAVQTFVPQAPLLALSQNVLLSTAALMLLASILSICSISDAPIAYTFLGTFAPGAVFAFLLFGQIVDMKNGAMLLATFRLRVVFFFVGCSALLVFALGTLITLGVF